MGDGLYVANLDPDITEGQLRDLFGQYGEVLAVDMTAEEKTGEHYAIVQMASEKVATKAYNGLNGYRWGDRYLTVSYPEVDLSRELTAKQRRSVEEIAETLGETDEVPLRQIEAIVRLCGVSFGHAVLKEALEIDASGGLMTSDGSHRRTRGGVFFYLARYRMSSPVRRIVYNRKGKMPQEDSGQVAANS
jgi:hypothetical protein